MNTSTTTIESTEEKKVGKPKVVPVKPVAQTVKP